MAENIETIGTGKDHSTIQIWADQCDVSAGGGTQETGNIDTSEEFGRFDFDSITGTPDATNYCKLTVSADNRHAGIWSTSKARVRSTSGHVCNMVAPDADYFFVEYLQFYQNGSGSSDECIRIGNGCNNVLISRCILVGQTSVNDQDAIHTPAGGNVGPVYIDNCLIYRHARCGVFMQPATTGTVTVTIEVDFCTIADCGHQVSNTLDPGGFGIYADSDQTCNFTTRNCAVGDSGTPSEGDWDGDNYPAGGGDPHSFSGDYNAYESNGATPGVPGTNNQGPITTTDAWTDPASDDYTIKNASSALYHNGDNTQMGSEPDSRQDFSIDIIGQTRHATTPSIGCFELVVAGGGPRAGAFGHAFKGTMGGPIG